MLDTVVIGGGFWGTACAAKLSSQGREVLLLDDLRPNGASRAAAGIVKPEWYKKDIVSKILPAWWSDTLTGIGFDWLRASGLVEVDEIFINQVGKSNRDPRSRGGCYLIPSSETIFNLHPRQRLKASTLRKVANGWRVSLEGAEPLTARNVVIAAGAFTDELLARSGLKPVGVAALKGRGIVARVGREFTAPHTIMTRPYTHFTLRPWGSATNSCEVRIGDTIEKTEERVKQNSEILFSLAGRYTFQPSIINVLQGLRPVRNKIIADELEDGLIVATGGHRVGLCLAGGVAHHVAGLLK